MAKPKPTRADFHPFAVRLLELEHEALQLGMHETRLALNKVVQTAGWELSAILEKQHLKKRRITT